MALNNQYLILDSHLNNIGILTVDGATKFTNDSISMQIADTDNTNTQYDDDISVGTDDNYRTEVNSNFQSKHYDHSGTVTVPQGQPDSDKVVAGNYLAYYDKFLDRWYVMYIYTTAEESTSTASVNTVAYVCNMMLRDLAFSIPDAATVKNDTIQTVFSHVFQNSGWTVEYNTSNTSIQNSDSFDGKTKATVLLQSMLQLFGVEITAYVKINSQGKITDKIAEVTDELSSGVIYEEAIFGKNITNIKRTTVSAPITKLYVYGPNETTMRSRNDGKDYIVDDNANQLYNYEGSQANSYLEGVIVSNQIESASGLKSWGQQMLTLFNHPRTFYEVNVSPDFLPPLGTTIRFKDKYISPELNATGRVIQRTLSFSSPNSNSIAFGEFVTVPVATPAWLTNYQSALADAVSKAITDASAITPVLSHPDGLDFAQGETSKRLILSAWVGKQNISTYVDSKGFAWRHINTDGSIDPNWESTGDLINVTPSLMGNIRAYIDGDYISTDPEFHIDNQSFKLIGSFDPSDNPIGRVAQHMEPLDDGTWYQSSAHDNGVDTNFILRDKNLNYVSRMVLKMGGHGTSFGVKYINGSPWIITAMKNDVNDWDIVRFQFKADATLGYNDVIHLFDTHHYARVNYDRKNDLLAYCDAAFNYRIVNMEDAEQGIQTVEYSINWLDYDFTGDDQIVQGQTLDFPYVYWNVGDQGLKVSTELYCVNAIHKGEVFHAYYDPEEQLGITNKVIEPEGLGFHNFGDGYKLVHSFNVTPDGNPPKRQMIYTSDFAYREEMPVINDGNNSNDKDE